MSLFWYNSHRADGVTVNTGVLYTLKSWFESRSAHFSWPKRMTEFDRSQGEPLSPDRMQALSEQARGIGFSMGPYVGRIGADRRELEKIQRDFAVLKGHIAGAALDQGANLLAEVWRGISSGIDARMSPDEPGAQTRFL